MTDNSVSVHDRATTEFALRCVLADPCRSSVKPNWLADVLGWSTHHTGAALASLGRDPPADLALERRPGGRGGQRWGVERV